MQWRVDGREASGERSGTGTDDRRNQWNDSLTNFEGSNRTGAIDCAPMGVAEWECLDAIEVRRESDRKMDRAMPRD